MIDLIKKISIIGLVITALSAFGYSLNTYIDWSWLIMCFKILRVLLDPVSFFSDNDTLILIFGKIFSIMILVWGLYGSIYVMRVFNSKS